MSEVYLKSYSWNEITDPQDQYQTKKHLCHGYDVYGDMLSYADLTDLKLLLLLGKPPSLDEKKIFNVLEFCLANAGPRDFSVRAAMNAGVGGSSPAAALMASLAVSSGNLSGINELKSLIESWQQADEKIESWIWLENKKTQAEILPDFEHIPGFEIKSKVTPLPVLQSLKVLSSVKNTTKIQYLYDHHLALTQYHQKGLTMISVAACVYLDLGLSIEQAQYHYLQAKLVGAAHHAIEQKSLGWKNFPFAKKINLKNDPGFKGLPEIEGLKPCSKP